MGGIGISLDSSETEGSPSTPPVSLPPEVVEDTGRRVDYKYDDYMKLRYFGRIKPAD